MDNKQHLLNCGMYGIILLITALYFILIYGGGVGLCQSENVLAGQDNAQKAELTDAASQKVTNVPYVSSTADSVPLVADAQIVGAKETVNGLKDAGYSLDEIVGVLKNDKKSAPEISIACLKSGFNGGKIFAALKKAGFSEAAAQAAVPTALRSQGQLFHVYTNNPDSVPAETAMITPNPFNAQKSENNTDHIGAAAPEIKKDTATNVSAAANQISVPVSVGVTFNGLGDWSTFQNQRFGTDQ
jgi:hypothetical protein